jgi:hypothetical protein
VERNGNEYSYANRWHRVNPLNVFDKARFLIKKKSWALTPQTVIDFAKNFEYADSTHKEKIENFFYEWYEDPFFKDLKERLYTWDTLITGSH